MARRCHFLPVPHAVLDVGFGSVSRSVVKAHRVWWVDGGFVGFGDGGLARDGEWVVEYRGVSFTASWFGACCWSFRALHELALLNLAIL